MARGNMVYQKHEADSSPISRSNQSPTMDTYLYDMKFSVGEITELTASIIAELMHSQVT